MGLIALINNLPAKLIGRSGTAQRSDGATDQEHRNHARPQQIQAALAQVAAISVVQGLIAPNLHQL